MKSLSEKAETIFQVNNVRLESFSSSENLYYPDYRSNISALPNIVLDFFFNSSGVLQDLAKGRERIIFFIADALGVYTLSYWSDLLQKFIDKIAYSEVLSSIAPTTTASALPTLTTGLLPPKHGVSGYRMYLKELGGIVKMFDLQPVKWRGVGEIYTGEEFKLMYGETIFEKLSRENINSYYILKNSISESLFSKEITRGANVTTYHATADIISSVNSSVKQADRSLVYVYWEEIDTLSHEYGPFSEQVAEGIKHLLWIINEIYEKNKEEVLLLLVADHGHIEVNQQEVIRTGVSPCAGCLTIPFGERRFLYFIRREDAYSVECERCRAIGIENYNRLFGDSIDEKVSDRFGNLVVLVDGRGIIIYKYREEDQEKKMRGHHGGLSREELLVPFIVLK